MITKSKYIDYNLIVGQRQYWGDMKVECAAEVVARKYIAALNKGDTEQIFALFADDAEVVYPGGGQLAGTHAGKEAIRKLYSPKASQLIREFETTIINTVSRGGIVAMEFQSRIVGNEQFAAFNTCGSLFMDTCNGQIQRLAIYLAQPTAIRIGGKDLAEQLSVADMGMLAAVAWAVV